MTVNGLVCGTPNSHVTLWNDRDWSQCQPHSLLPLSSAIATAEAERL